MTPSLDTFLRRLRRGAQLHKSMNARIVDEAREHLLDAIDASVQRGLSFDVAEREAFARFGDADEIGGEFRRLYRWDTRCWDLGRIAISVVASAIAALMVQLIINLRMSEGEALRLAPEFSQAAIVSVTIVVGLAAAWEICRKPFNGGRASVAALAFALLWAVAQRWFAYGWLTFLPGTLLILIGYMCTRLDLRPARLALLFVAFATLLFAGHGGTAFGVTLALAESSGLLIVWTVTVAILSRLDHALLESSD